MSRFGSVLARYGLGRFLGGRTPVAELDYASIIACAVRMDVTDSSGTVIGALYTPQNVQISYALDQIGSISFTAPATDPNVANLIGGNHVKVYHKDCGYMGEFILRKPTLSVSQKELRLDGWSLLQELVFANTYLRRQYSNVAVSDILSTHWTSVSLNPWLYGLFFLTGWDHGTVDAGLGNITVAYEGQSIFDAIAAIASRLKKHFREGATTRTLDFGEFGTDSGYRLVAPQLMTSDLENNALAGIVETVEEVIDSDEIWNTIIPLGGGQGLSALTIETSTRTTPYTIQTARNSDGSFYWYIADAASVALHEARVRVLPFNDINPLSNSDADVANAADALYDKASAYLQWYKDEHITLNVSARRVPWALKVGDKIRMVYRGVVTQRGEAYKWVDLDALYWVMDRVDAIGTDGAADTKLTLSNLGRRQIDDAQIIIGALQQIKVMQTFVQPFLGRESYVYREELAPSHVVTCPVDIDNGVLYLNSCRLTVQTRPLRSTITATVAAGGGNSAASSKTTADSDATSTTPADQTSYSNTDHTHNVSVAPNSIGSDYFIGMYLTNIADAGSGQFRSNKTAWMYEHTSGADAAHTHTIHSSAHSHSHGHGMAHTHDAHSHTMTVTYGIFDDTAYPSTISLSIDSIDRTTALGGPWNVAGGAMNSVLDITTYLVNAAGGLRQNHSLVFSCTGGLGQVIVTIRILETTQSIAVV